MNYINTSYKDLKLIVSVFFLLFVGITTSIGQNHMTKISDGTVVGTAITPQPGLVLELESTNKGFLAPRLTTAQRDAITTKIDGMLIYNTTTSCLNYWSALHVSWLNMCGAPPNAEFKIDNCVNVVLEGTLQQGVSLQSNSTAIKAEVLVNKIGMYKIKVVSDNGYSFSTSGEFLTTGLHQLILPGSGTPRMGRADILDVFLNDIEVTCKVNVAVTGASVNFEMLCGALALSDYEIGVPLGTQHEVQMSVNVTQPGFWSIESNQINGYSFSGSGTFAAAGPGQSITLRAIGTPIASGTNTYTLVSNSSVNATCNITSKVKEVSFTVDCLAADVQGQYIQDEALVMSSNKVILMVNVASLGSATLKTNTVAGIYFSSGVVNFTKTGNQPVTLVGYGTPTMGGQHTYTIENVTGIQQTCGFDVTVESKGVTYNMVCSTVKVAGDYAPGVAMKPSNTITVSVNVQYAGPYTITTNQVNGISFSASGTFTNTGSQEVVLTATGTPTAGGEHEYTLTSNSTKGTTSCKALVGFKFRKMNVLGLGGGIYQPGTADNNESARAILMNPANFGPNGIVKTDGLTITNGGYHDGTSLKNDINNNKIDIIVVGYNYTPNNASKAILDDFLKNKKGVIIYSQENLKSDYLGFINQLQPSPGMTLGNISGFNNNIVNIDDPIINGPFKDLRNLHLGVDLSNSYTFINVPSAFKILSTNVDKPNEAYAIKHNTLGLLMVGDSGWIAGRVGHSSKTIYPALITASGAPLGKVFHNDVMVYNADFYANAMAWAIKYVQDNIDVNYQVK